MIPEWLLNFSVRANAFLGGQEGMSLCGQFYSNRLRRGGWFWKSFVYITDRLFWFESQHCRKAYLRRKR